MSESNPSEISVLRAEVAALRASLVLLLVGLSRQARGDVGGLSAAVNNVADAMAAEFPELIGRDVDQALFEKAAKNLAGQVASAELLSGGV